MADPRAEEIRARLAVATPGPWRLAEDSKHLAPRVIFGHHPCAFRGNLTQVATVETGWNPDGDGEFIANAPTDIAYLLAKLDEAERQRYLWQGTNAETLAVNSGLRVKLEAAEERERALIAGVKETIARARSMQRTERSSVTLESVLEDLSRLLPSAPTKEGKSHERR